MQDEAEAHVPLYKRICAPIYSLQRYQSHVSDCMFRQLYCPTVADECAHVIADAVDDLTGQQYKCN